MCISGGNTLSPYVAAEVANNKGFLMAATTVRLFKSYVSNGRFLSDLETD